MNTTLLFLSKDVFFWPVVRQAASALGCHLVIAAKVDDSKLTEVHSSHVSLCLIDLSGINASDIGQTVEDLRERFGNQLRCVAFGPHVQEARLQAAAAAGCDPVLSRGQLNARLDLFLAEWLQRDCS